MERYLFKIMEPNFNESKMKASYILFIFSMYNNYLFKMCLICLLKCLALIVYFNKSYLIQNKCTKQNIDCYQNICCMK